MLVSGRVYSVLETVHRLPSAEMLVMTGDDRHPFSVQLDDASAGKTYEFEREVEA